MKRSRFSAEQIIGILKEHEAGVSVADLCRKRGVSDPSIYKWKATGVSEAKRLKTLEDENTRLKRLVADAVLDNAAPKDLVGKNVWSAPVRARVRNSKNDASNCINVSGLSRVDCCCSQAMTRSAHAVRDKWFGHEARFLPAGKRKAVAYLMVAHGMSERRAYKAIGCCRMTIRYLTTRADASGASRWTVMGSQTA